MSKQKANIILLKIILHKVMICLCTNAIIDLRFFASNNYLSFFQTKHLTRIFYYDLINFKTSPILCCFRKTIIRELINCTKTVLKSLKNDSENTLHRYLTKKLLVSKYEICNRGNICQLLCIRSNTISFRIVLSQNDSDNISFCNCELFYLYVSLYFLELVNQANNHG